MPPTIAENPPAADPASPTRQVFEPWALDRATDIIAAARATPYLVAVKEIALTLMFTRSEGVRDGLRQGAEIIRRKP